jgi:hypothetical protein
MGQAEAMGRRVAGLAAALVVLASAAAAGPLAAGASSHPRPKAHPLVQTGRTTFWECPKKTTQILVAVNTLTLHRGATLNVNFTVRNGAAAPCNYTAPYAGAAPGPTAATLEAGPCGSIGLKVLGAHRHNVWPGVQVVHCPALGFAQLAPNGTVSGVGSWDQTKPNSTKRVATGNYTLVVDHFSFPLRIVSH